MDDLQELDFGNELPELDFKEDSQKSGVGVGDAVVAGAAGVGLAYGAKKIIEPHMKRRALHQGFEEWRQQLELPKGQSPDLITQRIQDRVGDAKTTYANKAGEVKLRTKQASARLQQTLSEFDQTVLKSSVESLTGSVKEGYPKFLQSGYNNYEQGLSAAEDNLSKQGINYRGSEFKNNIIDKTISYAKSKGYQPGQYVALTNLKEGLEDGNISLTRAKGLVTTLGLEEKMPNNLMRVLRENWGGELERIAPKEVQVQLKDLNSKYKPFAEVRNALSGVIDPTTGQADTTKLYRYINTYATTQKETGISRVMEILQKDIPDVGKRFESLKNVKNRRQALVNAPGKAQVYQQQRLQELFTEAQEKLATAQQWARKAEEANDRLGVLNKTIGKQKGVAGQAVRAGAAGAGLRRIFSAAPMLGIGSDVMSAITNSQDLKGMTNEQVYAEWLKQQGLSGGGI